MTANDLITLSLKTIGAIAKAEIPTPDEAADALTVLNGMLDAWGAERLTIFGVVRTTFNLVVNQQVYTIGPNAVDWNMVRPLWIQDAGLISQLNEVTEPVEIPLFCLSDDDWANVTIKSVPSALPRYLYYDYAFPIGNISLWPIPNVGQLQIALYLPTPIVGGFALTSVLSIPPGYLEALQYNLAVRLCPQWGRAIDPTIAALAVDSFARIKRANKRGLLLECDEAIVVAGRSPSIWNWLTGGFGTRGST